MFYNIISESAEIHSCLHHLEEILLVDVPFDEPTSRSQTKKGSSALVIGQLARCCNIAKRLIIPESKRQNPGDFRLKFIGCKGLTEDYV